MEIVIYHSKKHDLIFAAEKGSRRETDVTDQVLQAIADHIGMGYKVPLQQQGRVIAEIGVFTPGQDK
jgi:hypothetical protein